MVEVTYRFKNFSIDARLFIRNHPEFSHILGSQDYVFNHVDVTTEFNFKKALSKYGISFTVNGGQLDNASKYLDELLTDQLFFTTETAVTKTNIGTTYTDVFTDFAGRPFFIDTTGFTRLAVQILWTKVGGGTQTLRVVEDSTNTQILESPSLITGSNDFANVAIPQGALNFKGRWRLQVKSTTAQDDPVFAGMRIYLRR